MQGAFSGARFSSANISRASNVCTLLASNEDNPGGLSRRRHPPHRRAAGIEAAS